VVGEGTTRGTGNTPVNCFLGTFLIAQLESVRVVVVLQDAVLAVVLQVRCGGYEPIVEVTEGRIVSLLKHIFTHTPHTHSLTRIERGSERLTVRTTESEQERERVNVNIHM